MGKKLNFSEDFEKAIIEFYCKPNTLNETVRHFSLNNRQAVKKILAKYNIDLHDTKSVQLLWAEKGKQTCLKKYGVESSWQADSIKQKIKQTCLERYGGYTLQSDSLKAKVDATNLKRYGRINLGQFGSPEFNKAMNQKYGVDWYPQTQEYHKKAQSFYKYKEEHFDSFPELCFYIYCIEHSIKIEHCPTKFEYEYEGTKHYYIPDFKVQNQIIEIKGPQFLKEDGTWHCLFDHTLDGILEAKHQCALKNNVEIIYDYSKYIDYFYSKNYEKNAFLV